ncbi:TetR/AcrR family transcriptional regulator [Hamadaea tsunoensis]|uniref:TetR/AcrR family transcriptional regulator n=1 Tax=Hamadaea tsunoensis TaxID=53368 RepID=UPI0003FF2E0E|nr:TetR/AcrR family transcriptional regulator [Hamadaea tsunoensis]
MTPTERKDATYNRQRLVEAAGEVFRRDGTDAALDEIARTAGVANATLYRHFPTRERLLTAVYAQSIDAMCSDALERIESGADDALLVWLGGVVEHMQANRGLREGLAGAHALEPDHTPVEIREWHDRIAATAEPLFTRAQRSGLIKSDARWTDVLALTAAVGHAAGSDHAAGRRLLDIVLDGLRPAHGTTRRAGPP